MAIEKKKKHWFKLKRYPHIGLPLKKDDRFNWIEPYVKNGAKIAMHRFLPFIHNKSKVRRFRKRYCPNCGEQILSDYGHDRVATSKSRELFYASHLDSLVYSYYAFQLLEKYEALIKTSKYDISNAVTAYRSIPVYPNNQNSHNKSNIEFAKDVFDFISNYDEEKFCVIAIDVSSFFDSLKHSILREKWMQVLEVDKLPKDHWNVFKNITRFSYVDIQDLFEEFKDKIYTQKKSKTDEPLPIRQKRVAALKFMRSQNAIAFCDVKEFLKVKHKLIKSNKTDKEGKLRDYGIPQGSPISSVLANIYMLDFDKALNDFIRSKKGLYRRYSDDIAVVLPISEKDNVLELAKEEIKKIQLEIQPKKTQVFVFERQKDKLRCFQEFEKALNPNKNFSYLGFEFDGENVKIKSASVSKYYRKMKRYVGRSKHYAKKFDKKLFKRRIYKKYSHKGAKRIRNWYWSEEEEKFVHTDRYNHGNFLTYVYKADKVFKGHGIKKQTSKHWQVLNNLIHGK